MDRIRLAAPAPAVVGPAGSVVGVLDPYPRGAESLVGVTVGATLLAFGDAR